MYIACVKWSLFHSITCYTLRFLYRKHIVRPLILVNSLFHKSFSSPSPGFPVNLCCVLKAESTKLSIPKAISDPSDPLDSRHGNALAL